MIREALQKVMDRNDLTRPEAFSVMEFIMDGKATPAQIAAFLIAMKMKGETPQEIAGFAASMRGKAQRVHTNGYTNAVDLVGTGGDKSYTFNISTVAAFVVAGCGIPVAKHGNRSVSSKCGSADVLENLGVKLDISPADVENCIREVGIGFLFAPLFHGAMKYAAGPRKEIGLRTIFNVLGPLTNPAGATSQVLGVYSPDLTEKIALVLGKLGSKEAFVVCGEGTFDEISICSPTRISQLKDGQVNNFQITPEDYGFRRAPIDSIKGGDALENAQIIRNILDGREGTRKDMVLFNAGAAFVVAGLDKDLTNGIQRARETIDSGAAKRKLEQLIEFTNNV